jgi:hypothetical protein
LDATLSRTKWKSISTCSCTSSSEDETLVEKGGDTGELEAKTIVVGLRVSSARKIKGSGIADSS